MAATAGNRPDDDGPVPLTGVLTMRGMVLGLAVLLLTGCSKAQETVLAQANSSDGWRVLAATRHGALTTGYNDVVIAVQDPMRAWIPPGDTTITMKVTAAHPKPSQTPPPVEMQPDGEPGHWLAIVELPQSDTWHCDLDVNYKTIGHKFQFDLQN
jgi:hypothetical protein